MVCWETEPAKSGLTWDSFFIWSTLITFMTPPLSFDRMPVPVILAVQTVKAVVQLSAL